jgi:hypothetical protein
MTKGHAAAAAAALCVYDRDGDFSHSRDAARLSFSLFFSFKFREVFFLCSIVTIGVCMGQAARHASIGIGRRRTMMMMTVVMGMSVLCVREC